MESSEEYARMVQLIKQLERDKQQLMSKYEESEKKTEGTALPQYLQACHEYFHVPLTVGWDPGLTSKGFTNPKKKLHPKVLKRWTDFPQLQKTFFDRVSNICCPIGEPLSKSFDSLFEFRCVERNYCHKRIDDEEGLRNYVNVAVESPVTNVLKEIMKSNQAKKYFMLGEAIEFHNRSSSLSDKEPEVKER